MARNSPNEVVEIESSDDDFEEPRRRIGWNYQGKAINHASDTDKMPSRVNGRNIKEEKLPDSDSDDLEVLEVNPTPKLKSNYKTQKSKGEKSKINGNKLPLSSTRKEIKVLSRAPQSTISQFFSSPKSKGSEDKNKSKSKVNAKEKKYASDKYISKKEDDEDNNGNKKDTKEDTPVIKWKKVTDTRDTAIPSDKSEDYESEEDSDEEQEIQEDTIDISSQDEIHEVQLAKDRDKDGNKHLENNKKDTTKKKRIQTIHLVGPSKKDDSSEEKEMSPPPVTSEESKSAVDKFIVHWKNIKSSKDDKKIEDKMWRNYYAAHTSYTHSRKFLKQLTAYNAKVTEDNIYMVIKDLLDNLKCYKEKEYIEKKPKKSDVESKEKESEDNLTPEEKKKRRKLRKIEEKLKEISDRIREAEDAEVDLEDDDNSSYLIEDRLKRQFSKLDEYYCKIANCSTSTGRPTERKFKYEGSRYSEINKRISAWVNKHKEFPDYCDILNLVKKVTKDSLLPLRPETVRVQAQEIFRDVGKMLKDRRESDDLEIFYSRIEDEPKDPGHKDEELDKKLVENEEVARVKIEKVFQDWVDKESEWRENQDAEASKKKKSLKKEANKGDDGEGTENIDNENAEGSGDDGQEDDNEDDEEEEDDDDEGEDDISLPDISTGSNKDVEDIESVIKNINETVDNDVDSVHENMAENINKTEDQDDNSEEDVPILDSEEMDAIAMGPNSDVKRQLENSCEETSEKKDVPILDSEDMDAIAMEPNAGVKRQLENSCEESSEKKKCREDVST